jgi:glycosyltransferase A (GT-A) superfamily protein (DUF2064 family)
VKRYLVLFARQPEREAREKGFGCEGADLFSRFALGWAEAARSCRARLVLAAPPEDWGAWRRLLSAESGALWISQRGRTFGQRLAGVARSVSALRGHAVLVGGDTAPSAAALSDAFAALDRGAEAVLAPAVDGGVSLVALGRDDADLLAELAPRQHRVAASLERELCARGRRVVFVQSLPDVDGRRSLGSLLRFLTADLKPLARRALKAVISSPSDGIVRLCRRFLLPPSGLRAPPLPA